MKETCNTDFPIVSPYHEQDERADNVILLEGHHVSKVTAEAEGDDLLIRQWAIRDIGKEMAWYRISLLRVSKDNIRMFCKSFSNGGGAAKESFRTNIAIMSPSLEQDERAENVFLLEKDRDSKITVEVKKGNWVFCRWTIQFIDEVCWYMKSVLSISEENAKKLCKLALQEEV